MTVGVRFGLALGPSGAGACAGSFGGKGVRGGGKCPAFGTIVVARNFDDWSEFCNLHSNGARNERLAELGGGRVRMYSRRCGGDGGLATTLHAGLASLVVAPLVARRPTPRPSDLLPRHVTC